MWKRFYLFIWNTIYFLTRECDVIVVVEIFSVVDHVMYSLCVKTLFHLEDYLIMYSNISPEQLNKAIKLNQRIHVLVESVTGNLAISRSENIYARKR